MSAQENMKDRNPFHEGREGIAILYENEIDEKPEIKEVPEALKVPVSNELAANIENYKILAAHASLI